MVGYAFKIEESALEQAGQEEIPVPQGTESGC